MCAVQRGKESTNGEGLPASESRAGSVRYSSDDMQLRERSGFRHAPPPSGMEKTLVTLVDSAR